MSLNYKFPNSLVGIAVSGVFIYKIHDSTMPLGIKCG